MRRGLIEFATAVAVVVVLTAAVSVAGVGAQTLGPSELARLVTDKLVSSASPGMLAKEGGVWVLHLPLEQGFLQRQLGPDLYAQVSSGGRVNWEALSEMFNFRGGVVTEYRPGVGRPPDSFRIELRGELDPSSIRERGAEVRSTPDPSSGGAPAGGSSPVKFPSGGEGPNLAILSPGVVVLAALGLLGIGALALKRA